VQPPEVQPPDVRPPDVQTAEVTQTSAFFARHQPFIEFLLGLGIVLAMCALLAMMLSYSGDYAAALGRPLPRPVILIPIPSWYHRVTEAGFTTYQRKLVVRFDNGAVRWIPMEHCPQYVWVQPTLSGGSALAIGP